MRYAARTEALAGLGGAKWALHARARQMQSEGRAVIELTIGEPDLPCPEELLEDTVSALRGGRIGYSNGRGEEMLLRALAAHYSKATGQRITTPRIMAFPGTQTALYAAMQAMVDPGDEVLVGDPMYATYEAVIAAAGGRTVPVPLRPEVGFRLQAEDVARRITGRSRVLFLNSPHNPSGAILSRDEIAALGDLALRHDLWILSDEVYADMIFPGESFFSPLALPHLADRTVVVSSISKSHAAPGLRSGWLVGPEAFCARLLPLSESMLFGNQPFIADATARAVERPFTLAAEMARGFARRAELVQRLLEGQAGLRVSRPGAGMFALVDVTATGRSGHDFANLLLDHRGVAVMPGDSFGASLANWLRLSLTKPDEVIAEACARIADLAKELTEQGKTP